MTTPASPIKRIDVDGMRKLPLPTDEQRAAFVEHVCYAHSWYKHIPLVGGGEFVVFLSGDGERFARGVTRERYRRECGHLAYAWRYFDDQPWRVDFSDDVELDPALLDKARVTLAPYCSNDIVAIESIASIYRADLPPAHPHRAALSSLFALYEEAERRWAALPEAKREAVVASDVEDSAPPGDEETTRYVETRRRCDAAYDTLRAGEVNKLERAIAGLLELLAAKQG